MRQKTDENFERDLHRMNLQWFAEDEDPVESDPVDNDDNDDDDNDGDFKILVEGRDEIPEEETTSDGEGPSKEELLLELQSLREKQSLVDSQLGDRSTLEAGFDKLSKALASDRPSEAPPGVSQKTWEETKKELSKNFYDDPMGAVEAALRFTLQNEVAPAFRQTQELISKTAATASKHSAESNSTNKLILEHYQEEVEEAVKRLPAGHDVYDKACQEVGMKHFTDIVQLQVQEAVKEATNGHKTAKPTSNVYPGGAPSRGSSKSSPRRVLTKAQQRIADDNGLSYEAAWRYFNEK